MGRVIGTQIDSVPSAFLKQRINVVLQRSGDSLCSSCRNFESLRRLTRCGADNSPLIFTPRPELHEATHTACSRDVLAMNVMIA